MLPRLVSPVAHARQPERPPASCSMLLFALAAAAPTLLVHPRAHILAAVLFSLIANVLRTHATLNITLEDTAPQLTYSPPACGLTADSSGADTCNSAWCVSSRDRLAPPGSSVLRSRDQIPD